MDAAIDILVYEGREYIKLNKQLKHIIADIDTYDERLRTAKAAVSNPLAWWTPNGKQEEFILAIVDRMSRSRTPSVLFSAANGTGKTQVSVETLANIIYGPQNGWFLHEPFINWPNPKIAWYITTKTGLTDVVIPEMKRVFPEGTYRFDKMGAVIDRAIHFENGWELRFFTMDVSEEQMESASVGLVIIDEPAPESIWKAVKSRGRMGMLTLLPMTPLNVEPYILDEIEAQKNDNLYARVIASVYDACEKRGIRGHLDPQIIDEMVEKYPLDEREARVYGDFMYFREQIWTGLDRKVHFVEPADYPVDFVKDFIIQSVDPHDSRPSACIYGAVQLVKHSKEYQKLIDAGEAHQQVRRIIFAETPLENNQAYWEMYRTVTIDKEPEMWAQFEDSLGVFVVHRRIIDKRYGFQTKLSTNIARVYAEAGKRLDQNFHHNKRFVFMPSYDVSTTDNDGRGEIAYGHNLVNKMLEPLEDGKPGLVIWKSCPHMMAGMTKYVRKRMNTRTSADLAVGETKIIEKYKDFNDTLRYFCAVNPSFEYMERAVNKKKDKDPVKEENKNYIKQDISSRDPYSVVGGYMDRAR